MNSKYDISETFKEKRQRKEEIAKSFREDVYSLLKSDSAIIKSVEDAF